MSKLEDIVPPLELCKQIPAGEFEDSVLVWDIHGHGKFDKWHVEKRVNRSVRFGDYGVMSPPHADIPAPTLAEILTELPFTDGSNRTPICCGRWVDDLSMWVVGYRNIDELRETNKNNPAAAALRLWLRVR